MIAVGVLVALSVVAAMMDVGSSKTSTDKRRSHPVPLHHAASIGGGWAMRVVSVTPNANRAVEAVPMSQVSPGATGRANKPPPAGAQDFMVLLSMTYLGGGKDDPQLFLDSGLHAMGAHNASYDVVSDSCGNAWPRPSLIRVGPVFSGRSIVGHVCFQIAKNDARSLMLYTANDRESFVRFVNLKRVWFALR